MYLSRLILNPRNRSVHRELANCYQLHRSILSAFPQKKNNEGGARSQFKVLYRIEPRRETHIIQLLVQSKVEPDWSKMKENYILKDSNGNIKVEVKQIDGIYKNLTRGLKLRFRLLANPTRKSRTTLKKDRLDGKQKSNGQRIPILDEGEQINWLKHKGTHHGFKLITLSSIQALPNVRTEDKGTIQGFKKIKQHLERDKKKAHKLTFNGVLFEGVLEIVDDDEFYRALEDGIGSAKGFGFGLLSIAQFR